MKLPASTTLRPAIVMAAGIGDMIIGYLLTMVNENIGACDETGSACLGPWWAVGVLMMLVGGITSLVAGVVLLKRLLANTKHN